MRTRKIMLFILVTILFIPITNVSAMQNKDVYSKTFLKSQEEIDKEFEQELKDYIHNLENKDTLSDYLNNKIKPLDRSRYVTELVGSNKKWFGPYKAAGQPGPVSFPSFGGSIYWESGRGPDVGVGITVSGEYVGFTINIGSRVEDKVTGYSANVPNYGSWYLYVEREMEVRKYNVYKISNGRKTYYTSTTSIIPGGVRLTVKQY